MLKQRSRAVKKPTDKERLPKVDNTPLIKGNQLCQAANFGWIETVKRFIEEEGVDVNARDWAESTPLISACNLNFPRNLETAKYLIEKGADVNAKDRVTGRTALENALRSESSEMVRLLLENGADHRLLNINFLTYTEIVFFKKIMKEMNLS